MAEALVKHPCFDARCRTKSRIDTDAQTWTKQHGANPEHRRTFTYQELMASGAILVRRRCGCAMGEHDDEMYQVHYDWLAAIHGHERPAPEDVPREAVAHG